MPYLPQVFMFDSHKWQVLKSKNLSSFTHVIYKQEFSDLMRLELRNIDPTQYGTILVFTLNKSRSFVLKEEIQNNSNSNDLSRSKRLKIDETKNLENLLKNFKKFYKIFYRKTYK
jgi:hypothetical protein